MRSAINAEEPKSFARFGEQCAKKPLPGNPAAALDQRGKLFYTTQSVMF
jgi:hypothetical protein